MRSALPFRTVFGFFLLLLIGCAPAFQQHMTAWDEMDPGRKREEIVASAEKLAHAQRFSVGQHRFSADCSGYVGAVLYQNGIDVFRGATELDIRGNGVRILHEFFTKYGRLFHENPSPGDLVFFDNTYDRNRDGKLNDPLTHVGIVTRVEVNGTVHFLHDMKGKVRENVMNLARPQILKDENGNAVNDYMRRRKRSDRGGTPHTAAGLFADFGSFIAARIPEPSPTPTPPPPVIPAALPTALPASAPESPEETE